MSHPIDTKLLRQLIRVLERIERHIKPPFDQYSKSQDEDNRADNHKAEPQPQDIVLPVVSTPPTVGNYYDSAQQERPRKNRWELIKRTLEVGGLLVALSLAYLTYRTLQSISAQSDSAQKQVALMRAQLEVSERPWLSISTTIAGSFICNPPEGCRLSIGLRFDNVGHMPAVDITYQMTLLPSEYPGHYKILHDPRSICEHASELNPSGPASEDVPIPRTIFPGEHKVLSHAIFMSQDELDASVKWLTQGGAGPAIIPVLVECFEYSSGIAGDRRHQSASISELFNMPPGSRLRHFAIDPLATKKIPASELYLEEKQTEAN